MRKRLDDGTTLRDHMVHLVERGRRTQADLDGPGIPDAVAYLWGWFRELELSRDVGPHGLRPIGYRDIDAWARLTDRRLLPHEVKTLVALDIAVRFPKDDD